MQFVNIWVFIVLHDLVWCSARHSLRCILAFVSRNYLYVEGIPVWACTSTVWACTSTVGELIS